MKTSFWRATVKNTQAGQARLWSNQMAYDSLFAAYTQHNIAKAPRSGRNQSVRLKHGVHYTQEAEVHRQIWSIHTGEHSTPMPPTNNHETKAMNPLDQHRVPPHDIHSRTTASTVLPLPPCPEKRQPST